MEESLPGTMSDMHQGMSMTQAVEQQRGRVQQFVAAHREQLDRIETELARQIERVAAELHDDRHRTASQQHEIEQRAGELAQQADELARLKQELEQNRSAWQDAQQESNRQHEQLQEQIEAQRAEYERRTTELESTEAKLRREQRELELRAEEHRADQEELQRARKRLESKTAQLEADREELEELKSETKLQRKRVAREFQERRAALLEELQSRRAELEALAAVGSHEHDEALVAAQQASRELQRRLDEQAHRLESRDEEAAGLNEQVERLRKEADRWRRRCEELDEHAQEAVSAEVVEQLKEKCRQRDQQLNAERSRAKDAERQIEALRAQLAEAESRASEAGNSPANQARFDDMQRRHEMLLADLRELKAQNETLKRDLAAANKGSAKPAADGDGMDWESRKRRLIAALEAESDQDDPQRKQERLTIEATIRATEEAVASKEHEIAELKQLLDQQSSQVGNLAVGAAAIAAELDKDEIVRMEREKLQRLQEEWQEKLRQAEIDLSLERAKIARERAELEDKLLSHAHEQSRRVAAEPNDPETKKPPRGRWLSRLGLKDDEEPS